MESDPPIIQWLEMAVTLGASDLHVVCGHRPTVRVHGQLQAIEAPRLDDAAVAESLHSVCPPDVLERFKSQGNADFALQLSMRGQTQRFRVNYYVSNQDLGAAFESFLRRSPISIGRDFPSRWPSG